jgi:hypothetical protein
MRRRDSTGDRRRTGWARLAAAVLLILSVAIQAAPGFAQRKPPPGSAAAICHECEWIRIQIGDIDEKIAGWQRQIATIHQVSNLADPGIQNALKDIDRLIAGLNAQKAALQAKLPDCEKRCAAARLKEEQAAGAAAAEGAPAGETSPPPPPPPPPPPEAAKPTPCPESEKPPDETSVFDRPKRPDVELPPAPPEGSDAAENWSHMHWHMLLEESDEGDAEDVLEVIDDINDCIGDALRAVLWDQSGDALLRLKYLRAERAYYEAVEAHDARLRALFERWRAPGCDPTLPTPGPLNDFNPGQSSTDGPMLKGVITDPTDVRTQIGHRNTQAGADDDATQGQGGGQGTQGQRSDTPP